MKQCCEFCYAIDGVSIRLFIDQWVCEKCEIFLPEELVEQINREEEDTYFDYNDEYQG